MNNELSALPQQNHAVNLTTMEQGTYLTAVICIQNPITGHRTDLRALFDCGSAATYITNEAA